LNETDIALDDALRKVKKIKHTWTEKNVRKYYCYRFSHHYTLYLYKYINHLWFIDMGTRITLEHGNGSIVHNPDMRGQLYIHISFKYNYI